MKRITVIFLFLFLILTARTFSEDIPPTFALVNFSVNSMSPQGYWKDAFTAAPTFSLSVQYPAKVLQLYLGGRIDFSMLNGKEFNDIYMQIFSLNIIASYNFLEFGNGVLYVGAGLGVNFEELQFGEGEEDAILGGVKLDCGLRKQISETLLITINLGYTYIPDTPFLTFGVGLSYSFSKFSK